MVKLINVPLQDNVHELLENIKRKKGFANNAEALPWIIRKAAGIGND